MYTAQKFCHFGPSQGSLVQAQYLPILSMGQVQPQNTFSSIFFPHSSSFLDCHILFLGSHCFKSDYYFWLPTKNNKGERKKHHTFFNNTAQHQLEGSWKECVTFSMSMLSHHALYVIPYWDSNYCRMSQIAIMFKLSDVTYRIIFSNKIILSSENGLLRAPLPFERKG